MTETLFFYDLETSGINPREQRIMQFAGQRTSLELEPIGEPHNLLIKLNDDILPDPDAILVTGVTPQKTVYEGITEAEFLKVFHSEIAIPGTIFVGYNTVRFDDEFMRYLHYRNFYDAYEWHWQDGRSRWDLLDVVRMTRALRPNGIKWPVTEDGKPTNRLELLTKLNGLDHANAHDALSDVQATIALAGLIRGNQPRLFDYLLQMRSKSEVERLVKKGQPFVYSSGKYQNEVEKTAVVTYLANNPKSGVLVYDLRFDPSQWISKSPSQLVDAWKWKKDSDEPRLPIKTLQYNRCPAVAPLVTLDDDSKKRLKINNKIINEHLKLLEENPSFIANTLKALELLNKQQQKSWQSENKLVDAQLYDGFISQADKQKMQVIKNLGPKEITDYQQHFADERLNKLLPLYKARNYSKELSEQDRATWEAYRLDKFYSGKEDSRAAKFFKRLAELSDQPDISSEHSYLLQELQLYAESILPESN